MGQFVDPSVSRAKFEDQLLQFRKVEADLWKRGCWIVKAEFPEVFALFGTPKLKPPSIVFGAAIEFTNYDMWAPSVRLVDPFTRQPYTFGQLPTHLNRLSPPGKQGERTIQPLMQASNPTEIPFLCIPGVREYHENPGHTGDSWMLHRNSPEGTLFFIVEQLLKYGIDPIHAYDVGMKVTVTGYGQVSVPE